MGYAIWCYSRCKFETFLFYHLILTQYYYYEETNFFSIEECYFPKYLVWTLHEKWYSQLHGVYTLFTKVVCSWWQNPSRQWETEVCLPNFLCWWNYDFYILISKTVGREVKTRTWCNFYNNYYNNYNNYFYYYNYYNYNNYNYWEKV